MARQLSFLAKLHVPARTEHGGDVGAHMRKLARPMSPRRPMHIVMRASRACGAWSMRRSTSDRMVRETMRCFARRYQVRVYQFANAGNHLHLLIRAKCRLALQNFLRTFAGTVARRITGARKGWRVGKFWDVLAYSRVLTWGRDFVRVQSYVLQNELETIGYIAYQRRPKRTRRIEETERVRE